MSEEIEYCCDNFKKALEDNIRLIDWYEDYDITEEINYHRKKVPIEKGYYIIDQYKEGEMCEENSPAEPRIKLSYCPYCGKKLVP